MSAQVMWQQPHRVTVGRPTPAVRITATATVSTVDPAVFGFVGVASIDGTGEAAGAIVAPGGAVDTALHLVVAPAPVPASGPMTFHATGTLSIPVFRRPGLAVVDVGTALDLTLTPRDAKGNQVIDPLAVPCTLSRAQNLFSFDIGPAPTATPDPVTSTVAPARTGTPGGGSSGPGTTRAPGSRSPSPADPAVSSSAPPTTATSSPARDSAAVANRRRLPGDWWLSVMGTMAVVAGAVGAAGWLRHRRRTPDS